MLRKQSREDRKEVLVGGGLWFVLFVCLFLFVLSKDLQELKTRYLGEKPTQQRKLHLHRP